MNLSLSHWHRGSGVVLDDDDDEDDDEDDDDDDDDDDLFSGRNIDHVIYDIERIIQERVDAGRRHGGLDYRHRTVINGWQSLKNDLRSARFKRGVQFLLAPFAWFGGALGSSLFGFRGGVVGSHCSRRC